MTSHIRIGLFQLGTHPAVILADRDLLQEPYVPKSLDKSLTALARTRLELRHPLGEIREMYISWLKERLTTLLTWLSNQASQPQVVIFPECSIPFECLEVVKSYASQTGIVFFAGTHSPLTSPQAYTIYKKKLGVDGATLRHTVKAATPPPAVLPIIAQSRAYLHPKEAASIFERTDVDSEIGGPLRSTPVRLEEFGIDVLPLVCAEALRLRSMDMLPALAVIVARDSDPERFDKYIQLFVENKVPVAFVNDASFGGSGIFIAEDNRSAEWWYSAPNHGRLPIGEAYLEVEVSLRTRAVEVGTTNPGQPGRLCRIVPILCGDDPLVQLEAEAARHVEHGDGEALRGVLTTMNGLSSSSPIVARRWIHLDSLVRIQRLTKTWVELVGSHISTGTLPSLASLERSLASIAIQSVNSLLDGESHESLTDDELGRLHRVRRHLCEIAAPDVRGDGPPATAHPLPIGRDRITGEVRDFCTRRNQSILVFTGLPAVGKSVVMCAAERQAGVKTLVVKCTPGITADSIYELILKSGGRVATGSPPRACFSEADMADALRPFDLVWFEDSHNLLEFGQWRNAAIQSVVEAIVTCHTSARSCLAFESRRALNIDVPFGVQVLRRRLGGLDNPDAVSFFEQQLRRAGVPIDTIAESHKREVANLVQGHPGMLILCADVCAKHGIDSLIRDLKGRRGFYLSAVQKLVASLDLSGAEKCCLEALGQCRVPVAPGVLAATFGSDSLTAIGQLIDGCLIERSTSGRVALIELLRDVGLGSSQISSQQMRRFHKDASDDFFQTWKTSSGAAAYRAAVEANYHAAMAGVSQPVDTVGLLDGLSAAARHAYDAEEFPTVIRLLDSVLGPGAPEDLLAMLADSYAWSNQFDKAFTVAAAVVERNRAYAWLFTEACAAALHSRNFTQAERAIKHAESLEPGSYRVALYKGRLSERASSNDAVRFYKEAAEKTTSDPWPFFYLTRLLLRLGLPEQALKAAEEGRQMTALKGAGRGTVAFENALLEQELRALLLAGENDAAKSILDALGHIKNPRPETIVCIAFVKAYFAGTQNEKAVQLFEEAIRRLDPNQARRAHTRAQVHFFRGRLLEKIGDLRRAEEEFQSACNLDPHNVQMKLSLMKLLCRIAAAARDADESNAAISAARRASQLASSVLGYDSSQRDALYAKEDLYHQFGVQ